ncbi:MAG: TAXI family TRAP transporter solute-binding subunit [Geminicoccaceae bacterium]
MIRAAIIGLLAVLAAGLGGWAWSSYRAAQAPVTLVFSAGSIGGEYLGFAQALRDLAELQGGHLVIDVRPSRGADANARAVAAGDADLGLIQSDTDVAAGLQAIATVFPEILHIIVRQDAGIATPADLAGKRIALLPEGSGTNAVFFRIALHYGLEREDFDQRYLAPDEAIAALRAGEVDAMARMIALGNDDMRASLRDAELALLPLAQAEAIEMFAPALRRMSIPMGALSGNPPRPSETIEAIGVQAVLVAGAHVPEHVGRELTALLFEARNQLVKLDEQAALVRSPADLTDLGMAIHPGARAYFTADEPSFVVEYAETIALAVSVAVLIASAAWQARRWLAERRKNRGDAYNGELASVIDDLRTAPDLATVNALEDRLFTVFRRVIDDIDRDRVARETIPTFDFVWRSAIDVLAQRRADLRARATERLSGQT